MDLFLTRIYINKVFHLEDIDIEIDQSEKKHLILTGKNGSGKTSVLRALANFLQRFIESHSIDFLDRDKLIDVWQNQCDRLKEQGRQDSAEFINAENSVKTFKKEKQEVYRQINPTFSNAVEFFRQLKVGDFLLVFYEANRITKVSVPKNPEKPNLKPVNQIRDNKQGEFLKFLVDLKIQEALARNENHIIEANKIKDWFDNFTLLLNDLFTGEPVALDFNYKDYSFTIRQGKKNFGFNELADGYSAIIDIIADLILKMQHPDSLTRAYEKQGIVLIDEIETHLHLELQKVILPMLTRVFPNIQFIVTTHSPFVLNSLKNCVAFDLEKQQRLDDLTEYSYEALAEGYFDVTTSSSFLQSRLNRYKKLALKGSLDIVEDMELNKLEKELDSLKDNIVAPSDIYGEYLQIKLKMK